MRYTFGVCLAAVVLGTSAVSATSSATAATTCASSIYVSSRGSDANAGTSAKPWKTLTKVSAAKVKAGTCVLLQGGATFAGPLTLGADDAGNAAKPVIVSTYGSGRAKISAGTGKGVSIYDTSGVSVSNLTVVGSGTSSNKTQGIELYTDLSGAKKLSGITISNVDVSGFGQSGILIAGQPSDKSKSGFVNVTVKNSAVHDNGDAGLQSYGNFSATSKSYAHKNITISALKAYNNAGIAGKGSNSGSGIVLSDVDGALIDKSVAYNNGANNDYSGGGPVGIWTWDSNKVVIQNSESYANKTKTKDGGGFDLDGGVTNSVMQNNYSHDNYGPGFLIYQYAGARPQFNNTVRNNVSENDNRLKATSSTNKREKFP